MTTVVRWLVGVHVGRYGVPGRRCPPTNYRTYGVLGGEGYPRGGERARVDRRAREGAPLDTPPLGPLGPPETVGTVLGSRRPGASLTQPNPRAYSA